jgi:hypothetical protein
VKRTLILLYALLFFLLPNVAGADCANVRYFNNFYILEDDTVILYFWSAPLAQLDLQNCTVTPNSEIRLLSGYLCDGDAILIDGSRCTIMSVRLTYY